MNLLLFKLRYIGDVLLTTPAIRLLRKAYPQAHIAMVVNKGTEPILKHNPHLDEVLTVEKRGAGFLALLRLLRSLRQRRYEVSVDFASGDRAAWLSLWAGARLRIGLESREGFRRWINNRQVPYMPNEHTVKLYLSIASETPAIRDNRITLSDTSLELYTSEEDKTFAQSLLSKAGLLNTPFLIAHTECRYPQNRWSNEKWQGLLNGLGMPVVFVGSNEDKVSIQQIQTGLKIHSLCIAGETTLLQTAEIMRRAAGFIGNDSGPMHIAAAMGIPVIGIFGTSSDPVKWHPWTPNHRIVSTSASASDVLDMARLLLTPRGEHI